MFVETKKKELHKTPADKYDHLLQTNKKQLQSNHSQGMDLDNSDSSDSEASIFDNYKFWGGKPNHVLNGISYIQKDDSFIITGKMWSSIYKVKLNYHQFVKQNLEIQEKDSFLDQQVCWLPKGNTKSDQTNFETKITILTSPHPMIFKNLNVYF